MLPMFLVAAAGWLQTSHLDRMRGQTITTATLRADNAPRNGPRAILVVSTRDGYSFAGLSITASRLDCIARCSVLVKFGSDPAKYIDASSTGLNAMIFETAAVDAIASATDIDVEVRFLRGGSYQYHFNANAPLTSR